MARKSIYPPGATNANWFGVFNAVSFQITLGSPMILYAKSIGATSTVLGVIAAMTPLLTICQIPAARYLERTGYRRFILLGWGSRIIFIFLIALVPLLSFVDALGKMALMLFCLFIFNLVRGVSSGAWLPWITELIPSEVRGRFLSRDQVFQQVGSLLSLACAAIVLGNNPEPWRFSAIFLLSALGGVASLAFLQRVPDIEAPERLVESGTRVPWREIVLFPPFFRLAGFNLLFVLTIGSLGVFTVSFLKTILHYNESQILLLSTLSFAGALLSLPFTGAILDRTGSKPMLYYTLLAFAAVLLGWAALAAGVVAPSLTLVALLHVIAGLASANFNLANMRITMSTMPPMGRSHFFAFFTVISSLGLGMSPLAWGIGLDAIGAARATHGSWEWNRFSAFYTSLLLLNGLTFLCVNLLHENGANDANGRADVMRTMFRRLARLWQK